METAWSKQINKHRNKTAGKIEEVEDTAHRKRTPIKGRSLETHKKKMDKLKRTYSKLFSSSEKQKESDGGELPRNKKGYFCEKYPTVDSYMKNYKVKESNAKRE